jgi:hypothetical protein
VEVVPLIEDLAANLGVELAEAAHLAVLLGDQLLVHGGDLDVEILLGKVEVGGEVLGGLVTAVPGDGEGTGLVLPGDVVEVEQSGELALARMGEIQQIGGGSVDPGI